ncbi:MAG: hypothetical protein ACT4PV_12465 [Planctomycetaceae bacterium]
MESVKAGWKSDKATIVTRRGVALDQAMLNAALKGTGFVVRRLERIEKE